MTATAIFIPTYARPHRIPMIVANTRECTEGAYRLSFIVEERDTPTRAAIDAAGERAIVNTGRTTYASAINSAYHATDEPYFFCGADDLRFHAGWLTHALAAMTDGIAVVGVNDLGHPDVLAGETATFFLVRRLYIERYSGVIDARDTVLHDYDHNFPDTEFVATARMRGHYRYCPEAVVEHLHPRWGKAPDDPTYEKGRAHLDEDARRYRQRKYLWESR